MTVDELTAEQLRTLDAEVETVVFNLTWYRVRFDDKVECNRLTGQNGGAFVCDRLLPPATATLYRAWGWSVQAISPEEGLVGFLAENAGEIPRGRIWETPRYSTDIAAAWEMEEKIYCSDGLGYDYTRRLTELVFAESFAQYADRADAHDNFFYDVDPDELIMVVHAAPEMRCRAALMTVREALAASCLSEATHDN